MINPENLAKSKKLKRKAIILILGLIVLFFTLTYFIGKYASEELKNMIEEPLALVGAIIIVTITLKLNKKIEKLKNNL
jgi:hypothetical protein